jgi:hypothetical protein
MGTDRLRWPPERLFWAVLETPAWRRTGPIPLGLLADAGDDFPILVEDLHAVGAPAGDGRVVVCAVRRDELATIDPGVASLTPEHVPECVEPGVDPELLELLVGDFEPAQQRRSRRHRHFIAASTVVLCAVLISIGLVRRAMHWEGIARSAHQARIELVSRVAPGVEPEHLGREVARLRAFDRAFYKHQPRDAAVTLASLLDTWPTRSAATPRSVVVSDSGVNISVSIEGDPSAFLATFQPIEDWTLDDPRLDASGGVTRLTLQMRPADGENEAGRKGEGGGGEGGGER